MPAPENEPLPADLGGRHAVVTGAARGIGLAIAAHLAAAGAKVLAVDHDWEQLKSAPQAQGYVTVVGDLSSTNTAGLAERLLDTHGPIELIVNNVGINTPHAFLQLDEEHFDLVLRTNLRGPWFFTRTLAQRMVDERRRGSVVFVSSLHDRFVSRTPHYSATKAAVSILTRELAVELAPHGIRVNAISPGSIWAEPTPISEEAARNAERLIPAGRLGHPDDVARMAVFLLSDAWAGYITGVNIPVDGGLGLHSWTMHGPGEAES